MNRNARTTPRVTPLAADDPNGPVIPKIPSPRQPSRVRRAARRTLTAVLRQRVRTHRAGARIHRRGTGTLATHCVAAGLPIREARSVAGTLRRTATKAGVTGQGGISYAKNTKARACTRYTPAEVARIAALYKPRKVAYKTIAQRLCTSALEVAA